MRFRLLIVLGLIVVVPLGALGLLGAKVARDERVLIEQEYRHFLTVRLKYFDLLVAGFLVDRTRELDEVVALDSYAPSDIRARVRKTPFVSQIFVRDAAGKLVFPAIGAAMNDSERAFIQRTRALWTQGDSFEAPAEGDEPRAPDNWYVWYWENGLHLIYWRKDSSGRIVGAEVDRARLMSDVINLLPTGTEEEGRVVLLDARDAPLYQWGEYEPSAEDVPRAELALRRPLSAWKLRYYGSGAGLDRALGRGTKFSMFAGLLALGVMLMGLTIYLYRESARELRDARQRVGFVNQVSHELKTPLTNIRMYAELLDRDINEDDTRARKKLDIIVSESQRLSRLIGNVLTFARQQRNTVKLHRQPGVVDEVVDDVLAQFGPSFDDKSIAVERNADAGATVRVDRDALAQIIANVVGNVEKYAAAGQHMRVDTSQDGATSTIVVTDRGPGVPASKREAVFAPFVRLEDGLTEGVAGTGIGLALARELAREHGGDLRIVPSKEGTVVELTLHTAEENA